MFDVSSVFSEKTLFQHNYFSAGDSKICPCVRHENMGNSDTSPLMLNLGSGWM
jgi:hypothetical protein